MSASRRNRLPPWLDELFEILARIFLRVMIAG